MFLSIIYYALSFKYRLGIEMFMLNNIKNLAISPLNSNLNILYKLSRIIAVRLCFTISIFLNSESVDKSFKNVTIFN